jgi:hypothetical protein
MANTSFRVVVACVLATLALSAPISLRKLRGHVARERFLDDRPGASAARRLRTTRDRSRPLTAALRGPPAQWFTQTLDHFDAENDATYQQR